MRMAASEMKVGQRVGKQTSERSGEQAWQRRGMGAPAGRQMRLAGLALAAGVLLMAGVTGCHRTVDDGTLTTQVKAALSQDSNLGSQGQQVQVGVQKGVVTLNGTVSDETASSVAATDAARVKGVAEVVNDLQVPGVAVAPTVTSPTAPTEPRSATPEERAAIERRQSLPPPSDAAPAAPTYQEVTAPAGSELHVRLTESLDSDSAQAGEPFHGLLTRAVTANGYVALPAGAPVSGRVIEARDATHFKGSSLLSIELTSVSRHGHVLRISTEPFTLEGKGRGKNSAEKIGGGAAIGAVLGGIFGGGKGAAIGAAAGGGGGAAVQGFTRGQQVGLPSESVVRFRLSSPLTVRSAEVAEGDGGDGLRQHGDQ